MARERILMSILADERALASERALAVKRVSRSIMATERPLTSVPAGRRVSEFIEHTRPMVSKAVVMGTLFLLWFGAAAVAPLPSLAGEPLSPMVSKDPSTLTLEPYWRYRVIYSKDKQ